MLMWHVNAVLKVYKGDSFIPKISFSWFVCTWFPLYIHASTTTKIQRNTIFTDSSTSHSATIVLPLFYILS